MPRRRRVWKVDKLCELQRAIDVSLSDYISQCYEAADMAPEQWRQYWHDEAGHVQALKSSMLRRTQEWIDHASGKHVELLSNADTKRD